MSQQQCWEHGLGGDKGWEHNNSCFFWWSPSLNDTRWVQAEVPRGGGHGFPEPGRAQCDLPLRWWQGLPDQSQQDPFGRIGQRKPTTTLLILWRTMDQRFLEGWQLKVCHIWNTNTQGPLFFCWCLILVLLVRWCIFLVTKPFCSQLAGKGLFCQSQQTRARGWNFDWKVLILWSFWMWLARCLFLQDILITVVLIQFIVFIVLTCFDLQYCNLCDLWCAQPGGPGRACPGWQPTRHIPNDAPQIAEAVGTTWSGAVHGHRAPMWSPTRSKAWRSSRPLRGQAWILLRVQTEQCELEAGQSKEGLAGLIGTKALSKSRWVKMVWRTLVNFGSSFWMDI